MSGRVLLTGATGFIGNRILNLLVKQGYSSVRALSRQPGSSGGKVDWFVGDLLDTSRCQQVVSGIDIIIHAAGVKRDRASLWDVNVQGTENLLQAASATKIDRFVHISSVGVIGADPLQANVFDEDAPCVPQNEYARSKWASEQLVSQMGAQGLPVAILRPANVFGDNDPACGLSTLIRSVKSGRFAYLGGRDVVCNYIFVEDVAHACLTLAEHDRAVGRIYHLADQCLLSEFVGAIADLLSVPYPHWTAPELLVRFVRLVLRVTRRQPGLAQHPVLARLLSLNNQARFSTNRLADELGFRLPVGWQAGLARVIHWYQAHEAI